MINRNFEMEQKISKIQNENIYYKKCIKNYEKQKAFIKNKNNNISINIIAPKTDRDFQGAVNIFNRTNKNKLNPNKYLQTKSSKQKNKRTKNISLTGNDYKYILTKSFFSPKIYDNQKIISVPTKHCETGYSRKRNRSCKNIESKNISNFGPKSVNLKALVTDNNNYKYPHRIRISKSVKDCYNICDKSTKFTLNNSIDDSAISPIKGMILNNSTLNILKKSYQVVDDYQKKY